MPECRPGTALPENAFLKDGAMSYRAPNAQPYAPGVGRRRADAQGQRPHHGPSGQEQRPAINFLGFFIIEAVIDPATHHLYAGVQRVVAQGHDVLDVPEITRADRPVATDTHFAEFEAREALWTTQSECPIGRQIAGQIGTARHGDPPDIAAPWHGN